MIEVLGVKLPGESTTQRVKLDKWRGFIRGPQCLCLSNKTSPFCQTGQITNKFLYYVPFLLLLQAMEQSEKDLFED